MTQLTFTENTAQSIDVQRSSNIFIKGTWDTATMTVTNTESGSTIRTPATADDEFSTDVRRLTFTPSGGGESMDITVTIEEFGPSRQFQV